ncbi:hypothetical protein Syun_021951 [Stephania yunnanensis]|uniref:Uncharacterized protein n=1 Tax=Stephania yunnanensis TaxID=152371 RepID=A0AAP0IGJ7_9MAGN
MSTTATINPPPLNPYVEYYRKYLSSLSSALTSTVGSNVFSFVDDEQTSTGIPVTTTTTTTTTKTSSFSAESYATDTPDEDYPPPSPEKPKPLGPWSTGLCDCFDDVHNCCITCWCPCITFGQIAEIVDRGSSSCGTSGVLYTLMICVTGCPCFFTCFYRSKMRKQHRLKAEPCWDCCVHCWCEGCALCQEYRELRSRGYDLSIGWHGNIENKQRRAVEMKMMEPGGKQVMTR